MNRLQRATSSNISTRSLLTSFNFSRNSSARLSRLSFSRYSTQCKTALLLYSPEKSLCLTSLFSSTTDCPFDKFSAFQQTRWKSSSSSKWLSRQSKDRFTVRARVEGLMSRAAYKLIELDEKYRLFKKGMTVVDLGFAPGSWSQVAAKRVLPGGRVIGVDILPCRPPRGVSAIQGNFLSKGVQDELKLLLENPLARQQNSLLRGSGKQQQDDAVDDSNSLQKQGNFTEEELKNFEVMGDLFDTVSYIELERRESAQLDAAAEANKKSQEEVQEQELEKQNSSTKEKDNLSNDKKTSQSEETTQQKKQESPHKYSVDLVLSDMCEPWPQTTGFWLRTINDPFLRMMNTSGNALRDHTLSIVSYI